MSKDELPDPALKFIVSLSSEDIEVLRRLMDFWKTVQGWCKVTRWLFLGLVAVLVALAQGVDALKGLLGLKH